MSREAEWLRRQGEYNRRVYERPEADHDDLADWKAAVLFYSIRRYTGSIMGSAHGGASSQELLREEPTGRGLAARGVW